MSMPQVPPRPIKGQTLDHNIPPIKSSGPELPLIPPRPVNRRIDSSTSQSRESYAQSPLNINPSNNNNQGISLNVNSEDLNDINSENRRPSSVNLPSIGQEGWEYADAYDAEDDLAESPTQIRNIAKDLKLHEPKPSLSQSESRKNISTVTRTDSCENTIHDVGEANSIRNRGSKPSTGTEKASSNVLHKHGIPQIGQTVPMYPNAGDVQAPSPAPSAVKITPGTATGLQTDSTRPRHHGRKLSGRDHEIPSDAYGRYGHGVIPQDRFDKEYYKKHPELFKKELGSYGDTRPEWALSSDDLNKIVRDTASRASGAGISTSNFGTPSEQIGFQASDEYTSRMTSPRLPLIQQTTLSQTLEGQANLSSKNDQSKIKDPETSNSDKPSSNFGNDFENDDVIHVDNPLKRAKNVHGGFAVGVSIDSLNVERERTNEDHGYGAPILASDEVAKEPYHWELEPAVSPVNENSDIIEENLIHSQKKMGGTIVPREDTPMCVKELPLEDVNEYEPLFPEEEKSSSNNHERLETAIKLSHLELKNRKFPSRDVWEDTPNSLQYTATVSSPQLPDETKEQQKTEERDTETPAQAFARRHEELAEQELSISEGMRHQEKVKKTRVAKHDQPVPDTKLKLPNPRFPSRDIWEDAPDSLLLQTTVASPQIDTEIANTLEEKNPDNLDEETKYGLSPSDEEAHNKSKTNIADKPLVPVRPSRSNQPDSQERTTFKQHSNFQTATSGGASPPVPTKAKPQVPARPSRPISRESSESVLSAQSGANPVALSKPKPIVPSRPVGSKIAALQGGFMSDLSKRLQLGPQVPKKEDTTQENQENEIKSTPLVDARKGRARGPARRAPAKAIVPATIVKVASSLAQEKESLGISAASTIWCIDPKISFLQVSSHEPKDTNLGAQEISDSKTGHAHEGSHVPDEINNNTSNSNSSSVMANEETPVAPVECQNTE